MASLYTRDGLLKDLRENVVEVLFVKVGGEERRMRCSLREEILPKSYANDKAEEIQFHQKNPDVISCWDIEKQGWRSFRIDSVLYAQALDNY